LHELDLLLERWLEEVYPEASARDKLAFSRLLEQPDPLLWDWLILRTPCPDPGLAPICNAISRFL